MSDAAGQERDVARDFEAGSDDTQSRASMSGQHRASEELEFHSPAESEDDSDNGSKVVGIAPPLDQHEKHHVFFCYSNANAPWVKDMIDKLESDELGFKCCFHERDFIPGMSIIENIVRSIQKTVFVLSRDFVASRWCNFERQMLMGANLREENKKVIPVMLRECDLPDFLQHMTYLEEWTPYFFDRFIGALKEPTSDDPNSQSDSFSAFTYNPNFNNGQQLLRIEATTACCPPCARFDDQIVPSELTSKGIRIPRDDYHEAISKLMETGKMKGFSCCSNEAFFWIPTCLILSPILAILLAIIINRGNYYDDLDIGSLIAVAGIGVFLLVALLFRCISRIWVSPYRIFLASYIESESASSSCVAPIEVDAAAPLLSEGSGDELNTDGDNSSRTSRMSGLKMSL
ncbi:uncharacterized protein LOC144882965 [Branchiostoma floridae x Branchiostoma japonicum]